MKRWISGVLATATLLSAGVAVAWATVDGSAPNRLVRNLYADAVEQGLGVDPTLARATTYTRVEVRDSARSDPRVVQHFEVDEIRVGRTPRLWDIEVAVHNLTDQRLPVELDVALLHTSGGVIGYAQCLAPAVAPDERLVIACTTRHRFNPDWGSLRLGALDDLTHAPEA